MQQETYKNIRYCARFVVEATSPLAIGGSDLGYLQSSFVATDFNGLPYLPATAITGYMRNKVAAHETHFGTHDKEETIGSSLIVSDALVLDAKQKVHQELLSSAGMGDYLSHFLHLPVRDHVRINHKGAAEDGGKFDREIVYKGTRFKGELELQLENADDTAWQAMLTALAHPDFYLGGGQTNHFGHLTARSIVYRKFDLSVAEDKAAYCQLTTDLNEGDTLLTSSFELNTNAPKSVYKNETITLDGRNTFFLFASGTPDENNRANAYTETCITWNGHQPSFAEAPHYVIPGSSIKGILAHRVAWHYNNDNKDNKDNKKSVEHLLQTQLATTLATDGDFNEDDDLASLQQKQQAIYAALEQLGQHFGDAAQPDVSDAFFDAYCGSENPAVKHLFGYANETGTEGAIGKVIVHDTWLPSTTKITNFMHNRLDRITGGTVHTGLYGEKVLQADEVSFTIGIHHTAEEKYRECLNKAIADIQNGTTALSGRSSKGHGLFQTPQTS